MSNRQKPQSQKKKKGQNGRPQNQPKAAPEPIDFDAIRSTKRRVLKQVPPVKIGGKSYRLPGSIPLAVTEYFAENAKRDGEGNVITLLSDMQAILRTLFGADQWAEISEKIDITDVPHLFNTVFDAYGESVGESSNSGQS